MATFQARIEDKIGDIPLLGGDSDDSQQAITDALTDSASEILDIISEEYLWASVAVTSDATSNPITSADQENIKILDNLRPAAFLNILQVKLKRSSKGSGPLALPPKVFSLAPAGRSLDISHLGSIPA